ncbi:thioredoxin family protein [Helicobacter anatolicus]|uniref:thioredoxin family protein n=1 Tax=Helicobacter anatolicus TaxID=2905874 RepID=UPI001E5A86EB|nr:thioredoxin family protein [Helicobacter anatolicus]MCE3038973.1 thioredoxin family protein [Helicobacter anatolicus]
MESITESNYEAKTRKGLVVVDFGASWCPDCVRIQPIMEVLSQEYAQKVQFFKVDIDAQEALKDRLNIRRIPTLLFLKDGVEVSERLVEPDNRMLIEKGIKELLG